MDAPPPQEDCRAFVKIAGFLEKMGLNSPRVIAADLDMGYLLMSDLGSTQYLERMEQSSPDVPKLYLDALKALSVMQAKGAGVQSELPAYDEALLRLELSLFHHWLCEKHLGLQFSKKEEQLWSDVCDVLVDSALTQTRVFVHRDFHSRNLMVTKVNNPGILDFQDAVEGPLTYDLVSLLKDCYFNWPAEKILQGVKHFHEMSELASQCNQDKFIREFDLMGVQRHLKAAGIFTRLLHRDGKSGYLKDVPRTLSYVVDIAPSYDELTFLGEFIGQRVLPAIDGKN